MLAVVGGWVIVVHGCIGIGQTLDCDHGSYRVTHALLIEASGANICGVEFQGCEMRPASAAPVFTCLQKALTETLAPEVAFHRDLSQVTVDDPAMHWVGRMFQAEINKSNDLTVEFRDESGAARDRVVRILLLLFVVRVYAFDRGRHIAFWIETSVMIRAIEESACDLMGVDGSCGADR
jgi:hypothetical protein